MCGTANESRYGASVTSYGAATQCAVGTPSTLWDFPALGGRAVWTCGGQDGGLTATCSATRVSSGDGAVACKYAKVSAGRSHTCAIDSTGSAKCW